MSYVLNWRKTEPPPYLALSLNSCVTLRNHFTSLYKFFYLQNGNLAPDSMYYIRLSESKMRSYIFKCLESKDVSVKVIIFVPYHQQKWLSFRIIGKRFQQKSVNFSVHELNDHYWQIP